VAQYLPDDLLRLAEFFQQQREPFSLGWREFVEVRPRWRFPNRGSHE
jgi:hypothetical protein